MELMILAAMAQVWGDPIESVESRRCKKGTVMGEGAKKAGQTASFQVDHLSHGDPNDTFWPASSSGTLGDFEGRFPRYRDGASGGVVRGNPLAPRR